MHQDNTCQKCDQNSEMEERGIYWELDNKEAHEFHGSGFEIMFNPDFEFERPTEVKKDSYEVV